MLGNPLSTSILEPDTSLVHSVPADALDIDALKRLPPVEYMAALDKYLPQAEPTEEDLRHPESQPLISAIDTGYADKKVMGPVESIRKGVMSGDQKAIEAGQRKLVDAITGNMSFGEKFSDLYLGTGRMATAHKMAADVVMKEMQRHAGGPEAQEAIQLGLIEPEELLPGKQTHDIYSHLIPQEPFAFSPEGEPITSVQTAPQPAQPGQRPSGREINTGARLTPFQEDIVESRQKAIQAGLAYKAALAQQRGILASEKAETERYKRKNLLPAQIKAMQGLDALRKSQARLAEARIGWYEQLPGLRRELSTGTNPLELEALKRVHEAIQAKEPIDKADWLIFSRWWTKGNPQFSADFMGRMFNRFTGKRIKEGDPFGWLGLPEPPSTSDLTPEDSAEAESIDQDMIHQFGQFLGSLLRGLVAPKEESKPKSGAGLSDAEKAELEQLRKKHGRSK